MPSSLKQIYGLYYPDTKEWFCNHKQQTFVMRLSDANHVRRVLSQGSPEPIVVQKYEGNDAAVYDGELLDFER